MGKKLFIIFVLIFLSAHECGALTLSSDGNEWIASSKAEKISICKNVMLKKGKDTVFWLNTIDLYYKASGKYGLSQSIDKISDMLSSENVY